jgi:heptosyltransferase-2
MEAGMSQPSQKMLRLLVVMPSWVGDAVMATPTLGLIRQTFPGIFVGGLVRPGIDQLLAGTRFFDEVHTAHATGVLGPKFVAAKIRPRRYDTALLLTNSFSTALITRIAGIPRRIGYDRDARGLLLTDKLTPRKRPDGRWAPIAAVEYYRELAARFLTGPGNAGVLPMELATTQEEEREADGILRHAGVAPGTAMAILNPGGNNVSKRWPARRFAQVAEHLTGKHAMTVLVNGSPGEKELVEHVATLSAAPVVRLSHLGISLGSLKAVVKRCRVMLTNDTGPRHLAAAFGVPLVTLFGPTDHRWTTIPTRRGAPEEILLADPTLPESEVADDHPKRCRVDRILLESVIGAVDKVLSAASPVFRP